jgi:hypothetical protein
LGGYRCLSSGFGGRDNRGGRGGWGGGGGFGGRSAYRRPTGTGDLNVGVTVDTAKTSSEVAKPPTPAELEQHKQKWEAKQLELQQMMEKRREAIGQLSSGFRTAPRW